MLKCILFCCCALWVGKGLNIFAAGEPCRPGPFPWNRLRVDTACPDGQGIRGVVRVLSGNQMPAPGMRRGLPRAVRSTVYIFELTHISQVTRQGSSPYYQAVRTRLVRMVDTDSLGRFCACLPEGRYSLFTKKGSLYYASQRDVANNIAPVEVTHGKMSQVECRIEGDRPPVY